MKLGKAMRNPSHFGDWIASLEWSDRDVYHAESREQWARAIANRLVEQIADHIFKRIRPGLDEALAILDMEPTDETGAPGGHDAQE